MNNPILERVMEIASELVDLGGDIAYWQLDEKIKELDEDVSNDKPSIKD